MASLARSNLVYEWRRTLAVVSVLGLLGTLILVQIGLPMFMVQSFMRSVTDTNADLFAVGYPNRWGGSKRLDERQEGFLWMHENVKLVERPAEGGSGQMFIDDDTEFRLNAQPVNPDSGSLTYPERLGPKIRGLIKTPGNIVLSRATANSYNLKVNSTATINGSTVVVAAIVEDLGEVFSRKNALMSVQSSRLLQMTGRNWFSGGGNFLIQLEDASKLAQTQAELQRYVIGRQVLIKTADQMLKDTQNRFLLERGAQQNIFLAVFAMVIGVTVATQTMRSGVVAQLKEYGALRALGVGLPGIAKTIMEQAFWMGLLSIPMMVGMSYLIKYFIGKVSIGLAFPIYVVGGCSLMILVVAILAGLLSLPVLYKVDPSELMR